MLKACGRLNQLQSRSSKGKLESSLSIFLFFLILYIYIYIEFCNVGIVKVFLISLLFPCNQAIGNVEVYYARLGFQ